MTKTLTISGLIAELQDYLDIEGDIPVFHQTDSEGNSIGTISNNTIICDKKTKIGKALFIFPYDEGIEDELYEW